MVGVGFDLVQSLLQAGCHLSSLLLLRAEHRVAPQLLLHLPTLVPEQRCESKLEEFVSLSKNQGWDEVGKYLYI